MRNFLLLLFMIKPFAEEWSTTPFVLLSNAPNLSGIPVDLFCEAQVNVGNNYEAGRYT